MTTVTPPVGPVAAVTCGLCGFEYVPGGDSCREHGCPVAFGTCATRHCPRCGYVVPDEERSVMAGLVRRLLRRSPARPARTVAELPSGEGGVVARLGGGPDLQSRLSAQGLAPGVEVSVVQRQPTFVLEVGETMVAVERRVAEAIVLRDPEPR